VERPPFKRFPQETYVDRELLLADGGITDNTGVAFLGELTDSEVPLVLERMRAQKTPKLQRAEFAIGRHWLTDMTIVSDAGVIFEDAFKDASGPMSALSRVIDVMYTNVGSGRQPPPRIAIEAIQREAETGTKTPATTQKVVDVSGGAWLIGPAARPKLRVNLSDFGGPNLEIPGVVRDSGLRICDDWAALRDEEIWTALGSLAPSAKAKLAPVRQRIFERDVCDPGSIGDSRLSNEMSAILDPLIDSFERTSTLQASISEIDADNIFRLGALSVLLEWPAVRAELRTRSKAKSEFVLRAEERKPR
jgi:hypothetical protein